MIVVTIVGILATLGVVGYRKMMNSAHVSEATGMLNNIRVAEENFRAESGSYVSMSTSLDPTSAGCPSKTVDNKKVAWDPTCSGGVTGSTWGQLPLHPDGPVLFRYTLIAGRAGETPPAPPPTLGTAPSFGASAPTQDWFVTAAQSDADGNGVKCTVIGTSWTNAIYVDGDGE